MGGEELWEKASKLSHSQFVMIGEETLDIVKDPPGPGIGRCQAFTKKGWDFMARGRLQRIGKLSKGQFC